MSEGSVNSGAPFSIYIIFLCYDPTICAEYKINILRIFCGEYAIKSVRQTPVWSGWRPSACLFVWGRRSGCLHITIGGTHVLGTPLVDGVLIDGAIVPQSVYFLLCLGCKEKSIPMCFVFFTFTCLHSDRKLWGRGQQPQCRRFHTQGGVSV